MTRGDVAHSSGFAHLHDVTLQRLDGYQNHGQSVFYGSQSFAPTVSPWNTVPVSFTGIAPGKPVKRSRYEDVANGTLPPEYRAVGGLAASSSPRPGERFSRAGFCSTGRAKADLIRDTLDGTSNEPVRGTRYLSFAAMGDPAYLGEATTSAGETHEFSLDFAAIRERKHPEAPVG